MVSRYIRYKVPTDKELQFLTAVLKSVEDLDMNGSALIWLPRIRIRITNADPVPVKAIKEFLKILLNSVSLPVYIYDKRNAGSRSVKQLAHNLVENIKCLRLWRRVLRMRGCFQSKMLDFNPQKITLQPCSKHLRYLFTRRRYEPNLGL